jgi:signal transduction histidine kinase/DNA-binding response OmpR family regulator
MGLKKHMLLLLMLLLTLALPTRTLHPDTAIVVGVYQNKPKVFINQDEVVQGFYIDILEEIARREGWSVRYLQGTWSQCLNRLERGEIDLLVDVAYSRERARLFDFNQETVLSNWAQIYVRKGVNDIQNILDLQNKTIAVMKGDISNRMFRQTLNAFAIPAVFIEADDFLTVLKMIDSGEADAGVVSRLFGIQYEAGFRVERSPIICCPTELRFAVPKGENARLLRAIDRRLAAMKRDKQSTYHQALTRWIEGRAAWRPPRWLWWAAGGGAVLLVVVFLLLFVFILGKRVREKTLELQDKNLALEREIAERRRLEREANRAKIKAESATRAKSEFLANMSHELRTPLNSVIGFSEILADGTFGELNEKQRRYVHHVLESGRHLLALINDILDLSKLEAGKMELKPSVVGVGGLLEHSMVMVREKALRHGISLELRGGERLEGVEVRADERKLKQIMYNLLSNAVKFTPERGSVWVEGWVGGVGAGEEPWVEVWVTDTGIGVKGEDRERIFGTFEQIDSSYSRGQEGTGLGLALTRRLVELHGGSIWVESEGEGKGSSFRFRIPVGELVRRERGEGGRASGPGEPAGGEAPLVLVVEDDREAGELLEQYLRRGGYRVAHAWDGEEGVRKARELRPEAVTLDILLPKKDGWEVLTELKEHAETAGIPVVIVSIVDAGEVQVHVGAVEYLVKPVGRRQLLGSLERAMGVSGGRIETVLVIDDEPETVEYVGAVLERKGCRVLKAYGGREGIERAVEGRPDLIVLDLMMPEVDGFEVVRRLREREETGEIPIVVFTAKDVTAGDRRRLNSKVQGLVLKTGERALIQELERLRRVRRGTQDGTAEENTYE